MSLLDRIWGRNSQSEYQRGMHAYNAGQLPEALEAFREVIQSQPDASDPLASLSRFYAAEASHALGYAELIAGNIEPALLLFSDALKWNDHFPELQFHAAVALVCIKEAAKARVLLESALAQNPDHFEARLLLAELAFRDKSEAEAELYLQQASDRGCSRPVDPVLTQLLQESAYAPITALLQQHTTALLRHSI